MRTKQEFIDRWKHSLGGMVLDAMRIRNGPESSIWTQTIMEKIEKHLAAMHADIVPDPIAPEKPVDKPKPPPGAQPQARKVGP